MLLKLQTDYSLRTLLYLGYKAASVPVSEVAEAYGISREHLFKVVQNLVRLGYVRSRPGRNGGITLARDAATINIADVVGHVEGRNGVLPCVTDPNYCALEPGCKLRHVLIDAERSFFDTLARVTLADLLAHNAATRSGGLYNLTVRGGAVVPPAANLPPDGSIVPTAGHSERGER
jgi:Rrf2 family nitric oxide-sensitive transcriptional repressor